MATIKITVTLEEKQVEEIRELAAAGQTPNVSAFVQHAVRVALSDVAGWQQALEQALEQTGGPLTQKERLRADELLGVQRRKKVRKHKAA